MSFGTKQAGLKRPTKDRFRRLTSIRGARDIDDLACRIELALDGLNSQLNSQVAPAMSNFGPDGKFDCTQCSQTLIEPFNVGDFNLQLGSQTFEDDIAGTWTVDTLGFTFNGWKMFATENQGSSSRLGLWRTTGLPYRLGSQERPQSLEPRWVVEETATGTTYNFDDTHWVTQDAVGKYVVVLNTDVTNNLELYLFDIQNGSFVSAIRNIATDSTTHRPAIDLNRNIIWFQGHTGQLGAVHIDPSSGQASLLKIWNLGSDIMGGGTHTPQDMRFLPDTNYEKLAILTSNNVLVILDVENPLTPTEVDRATLSSDWPNGSNFNRLASECDLGGGEGTIGLAWEQASVDVGSYAGFYTYDDNFTLTKRGSVKFNSTADATYTHEGAEMVGEHYHLVWRHQAANASVYRINYTDPDNPTVAQEGDLEDGDGKSRYWWGSPYRLVQYEGPSASNNTQDMIHVYSARTTIDSGSFRYLRLDKLEIPRSCFDAFVFGPSTLVENLNADRVDGKHAAEIETASRRHTYPTTYADPGIIDPEASQP